MEWISQEKCKHESFDGVYTEQRVKVTCHDCGKVFTDYKKEDCNGEEFKEIMEKIL